MNFGFMYQSFLFYTSVIVFLNIEYVNILSIEKHGIVKLIPCFYIVAFIIIEEVFYKIF